jgi:hypothetical protein
MKMKIQIWIENTYARRIKFLLLYIAKIFEKLFPSFSEQPWLVSTTPDGMSMQQWNAHKKIFTIDLGFCQRPWSQSFDA